MSKERLLEIGPGHDKLGPEWETLDRPDRMHLSGWPIDYDAIWGQDKLPIDDKVFDLVYASHVLEHLPWFQTLDALKEVHRILKPDGVFEVWVPDFKYIVACYDAYVCGDDWRHENPDDDPMLWINGRLFTYGGPLGFADPNWHRAVFDEEYLNQCLKKVGFRYTERIDDTEKPRGHDHGIINLGMRAWKSVIS